ncbi:hypothetical protein CA54_39960 [Symmachiella macrocystis]|uniref:Uncharacterized protein n=1 Tax=Symmachiella macrocystis TaxID=2527985 RepID=A0A5C6BBW1_9PLAN|nr:hypothetical protein [Symmachiella macrocystis]TWU08759.1 hypothetical protein CA54_39960 [Symmachiella macrocystis]
MMIGDANAQTRAKRRGAKRLVFAFAGLLLASATVVAGGNDQPQGQQVTTTGGATEESKTGDISEAEELRRLREGVRFEMLFTGECGPLNRIGSLSAHRFWTQVLPLSDAQAAVLTKLDDIVQEGRDISVRADSQYFAETVDAYRAYLARSSKRREETLFHARVAVELGLLTKQQTAFMTQRYLSSASSKALFHAVTQTKLGMTEPQIQELRQLAKTLPIYYQRPRGEWATITKQNDAALLDLLTPQQQERWEQLTAERTLPAEPPDLPAVDDSKVAAMRMKIPGDSPILHYLTENPRSSTGISRYQKRLLDDLVEVARDGVFWISLDEPASNDRQTAKRYQDFISHCEQIALLGILTEGQAAWVQKVVKK